MDNSRQPHRRRRRLPVKRKVRKLRLFVALFLLFSVVGLSVFGYASWRIDHILNDLTDQDSNPNTATASEPFSILLLGNDHRPETGTYLTDVMIIAAVDAKQGKLSMVSIPRDTKVYLSEIGRRVKANEAYNIGEHLKREEKQNNKEVTIDGGILAKKMASQLFEVPIDHYAMIDFDGFMAIVDEVGGIEIDVERELVYNDPSDGTHIHLYPGLQHADGKEALDWVRHRHDDRGLDYYSNDFDRNERQKRVIQSLSSEMRTFRGITKVFSVLDIMTEHIQTDLSKSKIKKLTFYAKNFKINQMKSIETPNVYWDASSLQSVIPEEDIETARFQLQKVLFKENGLDERVKDG